MTRATARQAALAFAATHLVVCAAGVVEPRVYGLAAGDGPLRRRRLRQLALGDAVFAGTVADGALRDRPLRVRLRLGAASDVARAILLTTWIDGAPRSRALLIVASLLGASVAWRLSDDVDAARP